MVSPISFLPRIPFNAQDPLAILEGDVLIGGNELEDVEHYTQVIAVRDDNDRYALCQLRESALETWSQSEGVIGGISSILREMEKLQKSILRKNHEIYFPAQDKVNGLGNPDLAQRLQQQKTGPADKWPDVINGSVLTTNRQNSYAGHFQAYAEKEIEGAYIKYIVYSHNFSPLSAKEHTTQGTRVAHSVGFLEDAVRLIVQLQHEKMRRPPRSVINWQELESANLDPNGVFRVAARHGIQLDPRPQATSPQRTPPRP